MSLTEQLEIRRRVSRKFMPPEKLAIMDGFTEELARSGVVASCLKRGDTAPDFVLSNTVGKLVSLKEVLKQGPVILSFYRGGW
jgi:hypothetical protein